MNIKVVLPGLSDMHIAWRIRTMCIWAENYDPEYSITDADNYDFLVVCNSPTVKPRVPKNQVIGVIMEPSWNNQWNCDLDKVAGTIFVHDNSLFRFSSELTCIIERPSLMFSGFYNSPEEIEFFIKNNFLKEKTEKLSVFISGTYRSGQNLYYQRLKLVMNILKSGLPINVYGRYWIPDGGRLKGSFLRKLDVIRKSEFSVCVENCSERNYISEKFIDPLLVDCVPVYYGCPNIGEVYDPHAFISFDINNPSSYLALFEDILAHARISDFVEHVKAAKLKYFREHNLYTEVVKRIKSLCAQ